MLISEIEASQKHHLVNTSDLFNRCPLTYYGNEPITFIGIGSPSAAHAISFVLDKRPISRVILIDVNQKTLDFTEKLIRCAGRCETPVETMKESYGMIVEPDQMDWRGVDYSGFEAATGLKAYGIKPENPNYLYMDSPQLLPDQLLKNPVRFTNFEDAKEGSFRFNFGCLLEGATQLPSDVPIIKVKDFFSRVALDLVEETEHTIAWMSNACGFGPKNFRIHDKKMAQVTKKLDSRTNARIWHSEHAWEKKVKDFCVRPYRISPNRPGPHEIVVKHVTQLAAGKTVVEICSERDLKPKNFGHIPKTISMSYVEYLKQPNQAEVAFLHILSLADSNMTVFQEVVQAARQNCDQVIILEHNRYTLERKNLHNRGYRVGELIDIIGEKPRFIRWCPGRDCLRRNMLLVYDRNEGFTFDANPSLTGKTIV